MRMFNAMNATNEISITRDRHGRVTAVAVDAGATMCTHLGNGPRAMIPRLDNYTTRQLADDRLVAGFIADGHHIPFPTLKNFLRAKEVQRSFLVTDAVSCADLPPGEYGSGEDAVRLCPDGAVRLPGTPYLAGSALTLDRAILNVTAHCGVSLEDAWRMASVQPARLARLWTRRRASRWRSRGGASASPDPVASSEPTLRKKTPPMQSAPEV